MKQHTSGRIVIDAAGYLQAESNEDDHGGSPFMAMGSLDAASSAPQLDLYDDFHREGPFPPLGPHPGQGYYGGIRPGMPPPPPRGFVPHHLSHRNQVEPCQLTFTILPLTPRSDTELTLTNMLTLVFTFQGPNGSSLQSSSCSAPRRCEGIP